MGDEHFEQRTVSSTWTGDSTAVVKAESGVYFPLRTLCASLGIKTQPQNIRLRSDILYDGYVRQFPMQTRGGVQPVWCLHADAVGMWLGSLQSKNLAPEKRVRLLDFQRELMHAARRILLGESADEPVVPVAVSLDRHRVARVEGDIRAGEQFMMALEARIGRLEERLGDDDDDE